MLNDLYNSKYIYELILCKPDKNKTQIAIIVPFTLEFNPRFRDVDGLKFTVNYLQSTSNGSIPNPTFNNILGNHLILLNIKNNDTVVYSDYFVIVNPQLSGVDKDSKSLDCYSLEFKLGKRLLRGYKQVNYFYDNTGSNGLVNYMLNQLKSYTIGTVSTSLLGLQRSFDYAEISYLECIRELESKFNCIFEFDNVNMVLNIHSLTEYGNDTGLNISEENLIKNLNKEEKFGEIITRYYLYGKNNLGIAEKNITGQNYVQNFDYFRNLNYMSQELLDAIDAYDVVLENNEGLFSTYLSQLNGYRSDLLIKQAELSNLRVTLLEYQDNENTAIKDGMAFGYDYTYWHNMYLAQLSVITSKNNEITSIQTNITNVNNNITTLNNTVSIENNFSEDELSELSNYIFESSNTISEISDVQTLYEEALYQLNKKALPAMDLSIDIIDFLSLPQAEMIWNKLSIGDYININYSKLGIYNQMLRLVSYTHNPLNNSLKLDFSNQEYYNNDDYLYMTKLWQKSTQTSNTVEVERPNYNLFVDEQGNILYNNQVISSVNNPISLPDGTIIGNNGLIMSDNPNDNKQMRILGNRILFTNDQWGTVSVGIDSDGIHSINIEGVNISGSNIYGGLIQGSSIAGGTIDVQTDIYVGNNIYIGDVTSYTNKSIKFYSTTTNPNSDEIKLSNGNLIISSSNKLSLTGGDCAVSINGEDEISGSKGITIFGDVYLYRTVNFRGDVNGLVMNTSGSHNHGIPSNTKLATTEDGVTVSGYVTFLQSGSHEHVISVAEI